jgi:hypothetical protein
MRIKTLIVGLVLTSGLAVRAKASTTNEKDDNQFREDVIACEEAVSHVNECCAGLAVQADACRYSHYFHQSDCGCDSTGSGASRRDDVWPVVTAAESHKIAGIDCAAMQAVDVDGGSQCTRLAAEFNKVNETHNSTESTCSDY